MRSNISSRDLKQPILVVDRGSANTGPRPGASLWRNCYRALRNQGQIGPKECNDWHTEHTAGATDSAGFTYRLYRLNTRTSRSKGPQKTVVRIDSMAGIWLF